MRKALDWAGKSAQASEWRIQWLRCVLVTDVTVIIKLSNQSLLSRLSPLMALFIYVIVQLILSKSSEEHYFCKGCAEPHAIDCKPLGICVLPGR